MSGRNIYIIRHGEIAAPDQVRRYIGQLDVPLSAEGIRQARLLSTALAGRNITTIFCSDLLRSVDTAGIISRHIHIQPAVRADIREIAMGEWEGKTFTEIQQAYPEEYRKRGQNLADYRVPGGESFRDGQARVVAAFADILAVSEGDILIVGHAGINRLLFCSVLGIPIGNSFLIGQDYGCLNRLMQSGGGYCLKVLNASVHSQP
ncbi:histidine phosphatase family protein [Sporomusa termitida]|uniref:Phosphoserine phosphatase 2 n=1 Tax=Sporomusa termitida TaxID=2377 RepID=A0A517DQY9_9FIRM|nr:histidine phosphatase family protein [Sporomusa termitida]QDR79686.1 Putative phosphoserine phosphatase 2 [Sporomusa termitida]